MTTTTEILDRLAAGRDASPAKLEDLLNLDLPLTLDDLNGPWILNAAAAAAEIAVIDRIHLITSALLRCGSNVDFGVGVAALQQLSSVFVLDDDNDDFLLDDEDAVD